MSNSLIAPDIQSPKVANIHLISYLTLACPAKAYAIAGWACKSSSFNTVI